MPLTALVTPDFLAEQPLAELLVESRLIAPPLAARLGALASQFPAAALADMFLEFELQDEVSAAGFGVAFPAGILDQFRVTRDPFLASPVGSSLERALADDPFAADNREHLNLFSDADPDWAEYDVAGESVASVPFVFFRLPTRFRCLRTAREIDEFCGILENPLDGGGLSKLLHEMVRIGPVCPYRVGTARGRGATWRRVIVTHLDAEHVAAALASLGVGGRGEPMHAAARLYDCAADRAGARFALSIDILSGLVSALDVECPYLLRIADPRARSDPMRRFVDDLSGQGTLSSAAVVWIQENVARRVGAPGLGSTIDIMLHHLKFRLYGAPHLRAKAYLLLASSSAQLH